MHIERVQVEEGFLDGIDINLSPGLNVLIGARGTGKTSLIELIRFCLNVPSYTADSGKRSQEHALSVLGSGQVIVTLRDGDQRVVVSRTAVDSAPRVSVGVTPPIMFSQTEIETVGLQPGGRIRLLDGFVSDHRQTDVKEAEAASAVRSLCAEAKAIRREIEEFEQQFAALPAINEQLASLAQQEQGLAKVSAESADKKKSLDALTTQLTSNAVAISAVDRLAQAAAKWRQSLGAALAATPPTERWPEQAGADLLADARSKLDSAKRQVAAAVKEVEAGIANAASNSLELKAANTPLEESARQLRREIETLQTGAGAVVRQGQQLRAQKAQLESLRSVVQDRRKDLAAIIKKRSAALDALEKAREERFAIRNAAADRLNDVLGPRIRIEVERAGQFEALAAAIAEALRGSGMRYGDLAPALAQRLSPRELLEAAESNDFELVVEAAGISKDRAVRVLAQLNEADLGALATIAVEDAVSFQLLDGTDYKDIAELSTGQRCTVVLPLVLQHTERLLIVDQPEDHIDNAFIADTLVKSVLARDPASQIVFSTHNANIPVLGEADHVIQLGSDGRRGFVVASASLDDRLIVAAISSVMEGGAEAFERRASFYGKHKRR